MWVQAATRSEMEGQVAWCVEVEGRLIALFHVAGEYRAMDNACTHRGGPLSEGEIEGDEVICPWHGGRFNLGTGKPTGEPAPRAATTYPVRVVGETIEIEIDDGER